MTDSMPPSEWTRLARLAEAGVLSASMMHEVRQPLFAIKALAQIAKHGPGVLDTASLNQLLVHVRQIEEMLDHYAGFGHGDEPARLYDLNQPVRNAVDMLAYRAKQLGVEVSPSLSAQGLWVRGRVGAMRQVAANLLQNALDAVEGAAIRQVSVSTAAGDEHLELCIRDSGRGVPEEIRERLFEPFVTSKGPKKGTGLGLYIARQLVIEAQGTMTLDSVPGEGTRVLVTLPAQRERS